MSKNVRDFKSFLHFCHPWRHQLMTRLVFQTHIPASTAQRLKTSGDTVQCSMAVKSSRATVHCAADSQQLMRLLQLMTSGASLASFISWRLGGRLHGVRGSWCTQDIVPFPRDFRGKKKLRASTQKPWTAWSLFFTIQNVQQCVQSKRANCHVWPTSGEAPNGRFRLASFETTEKRVHHTHPFWED